MMLAHDRIPQAVPLALAALWLPWSAGCWRPAEREVVVYAALDEEFSAPILEEFSRGSGVRVRGVYDIESTKTVGLVRRLESEASRPACDVFWNNEIVQSLRLQRSGLLDVYRSPHAPNFPPAWRSGDGAWHALAARARILLVNTDLLSESEFPRTILDLSDPRWKGRIAMAKPLAGTTMTHAAVLFAEWGQQDAERFFARVRDNVHILSGNKQVAQSVARGEVAWGVTDTDDAMVELDRGAAVAIVYPDQGPEQMGTLLIPNTLCIVRNGPHPQAARQLVDFLLSGDVERALAKGRSAQFPLSRQVEQRSRAAEGAGTLKWMNADFEKAVDQWGPTTEFLRNTFARAR